jgi:hypothetical protein
LQLNAIPESIITNPGVPAILAFNARTFGSTALFLVDSGATDHCFANRDDFVEYHPVEKPEGCAAEGSPFRILAMGKVCKTLEYNGVKRVLTFDAIHTPDIAANLISVAKLDEKGYSVEFGQGHAVFKAPSSAVFMEAKLVNGMYQVDFEDAGVRAWAAKSRDEPAGKETWHRRFGHIGMTRLEA